MSTYPRWFDYEVKSFDADRMSDINDKLVDLGVDARDVITVTRVERSCMPKFPAGNNTIDIVSLMRLSTKEVYEVVYKKKVAHKEN